MNKVYGRAIRQARREKGLTQRELADKLEVSTGLIGQYECGTRNPEKNLDKISIALDKDIRLAIADAYVDAFISFGKDITTEKMVKANLTVEECELLSIIRTYNALGIREIIKRAEELTHIDRYTE